MFSVRYELNFSAFIIQTVNWEACSRGVGTYSRNLSSLLTLSADDS